MKRRGRICVVRQGYFPEDPRVRRAVGALVDEGYDVEVICLRGTGEERIGSWRSARVQRLPGRHIRRGPARYLWEYASFFVLAFLAVTRRHVRKRFDVVQVHTMPDFLVFAALVPKLSGAKVVIDMHELMPEFAAMKFRVSRSSLLVRVITAVERTSTHFADRVLAVSTAQTSILEPRIERRCIIVPNVPDAALIGNVPTAVAPEPVPVVMTHGTMTEFYGVQHFIAALPQVVREQPVRALVVGDGEFLPDLKRQAVELGVDEHVEFTGRLAPPALAAQIARATLGVITLQEDGYGEIGVPNKLFDYAALGVPVVAPDLWGMRSYFGPDGLIYFRPGDSTDLAEKIVEALRDERLRTKVAEKGLAVFDEVRWEKTSRAYLDVVRELVEGS
ncbi:MAG: glycosyltransferase [Actinomycetota bacterium]|nr:glycosyltransferase [Actinomycetota bacterium]